jgi:MFS family permease
MTGRERLSKGASVALLSCCVIAAMSPWFSASAVVPSLRAQYHLQDAAVALLTSIVSIGFIAGTLLIAAFGIADRFDPRRIFQLCAALGSVASALALGTEPTSISLVGLRFVSGACMAGIYPLGMKMVSGWADRDMGLLVGIITASVTLGSAAPYLFSALGGIGWRTTSLAVAGASLAASLAIPLVTLGPRHGLNQRFILSQAFTAWKVTSLRLANLGYFGHNWETYGMWAWIGAFLQASFGSAPGVGEEDAAYFGNLGAFAVIACGALGCLAGGILADRIGRTAVALGALGISGTCCLLVGLFFHAHPAWLLALCLVWGFAIVADSGQFSSCIIELTDNSLVGTLLTVQICIGYLITLPSIHLVSYVSQQLGWQYAFSVLGVGPVLAFVAMARLRAHPDAALRLCHGKR